MRPSDIINTSILSAMQSIIHETFITGFGRIKEVVSQDVVLVSLSYALNGAPKIFECDYMSDSSDAVKITRKAKIGDPVFVIALQNKRKNTLTTKEPIAISSLSGYTILSAIAVPLGVSTEESRTRISLGDKTVFDSDVDLEIDATKITIQGGDAGASRIGDKVRVTIPAGTFLVSADKGVKNPVDVIVEGTITEGSGTVLIGD